MNKKFNASSGQVSKTLIILAVVIFLVGIIIFLSLKYASSQKTATVKNQPTPPTTTTVEPPKPAYEATLSDIKFSIVSSENLGSVLKSKTTYESDLTTTEKFIKVVVGAQNKGKNNIAQYSWDVGDIVDADGRHFVSINERAYSFLPRPDLCGALLKPEFDAVPCVKYYEVSKVATGLKVTVITTSPKKQTALIDLKVQ